MTPFQSLQAYEIYLYSLPELVTSIALSTLVLIVRGARRAIVQGEITFVGELQSNNRYRLVVYEDINARYDALHITTYGYEVWLENQQLYWYDSQPHPNNPKLASTHPHHKHVPPDIKHNRIPAPGLSFTQPNLPFLIAEIEQTYLSKPGQR